MVAGFVVALVLGGPARAASPPAAAGLTERAEVRAIVDRIFVLEGEALKGYAPRVIVEKMRDRLLDPPLSRDDPCDPTLYECRIATLEAMGPIIRRIEAHLEPLIREKIAQEMSPLSASEAANVLSMLTGDENDLQRRIARGSATSSILKAINRIAVAAVRAIEPDVRRATAHLPRRPRASAPVSELPPPTPPPDIPGF